MEKEFIPYKIALQLKELGFNEPCFKKYIAGCLWSSPTVPEIYENIHPNSSDCLAPTFSQAFRWFREKYNLLGCPQYFTGGYYCYTINDMKGTEESNRLFTEFSSYEEAELDCLEKLIQIIKTK